ncbi:helix-turn-helix domain-containing protein [bacterium]|nr:helix-turn-helix domain-containing protein [bacterium]
MLGQILKEKREAAGLTQEALALAAGVDRSYVSQLERDKNPPPSRCCSGSARR